MGKVKYIIGCAIFLLLFATNIQSDKYEMNYPIAGLTINNASETSRSKAVIYGDNTNEEDFIVTPKVNLPKGEYKIILKYKTDTDLNTVNISGYKISGDVMITEQLSSQENEKVITLNLDEDVQGLKIYVHFCGQGTYIHRGLSVETTKIVNTDTIAWLLILGTLFFIIGIMIYHNPTKEKRKSVLVLVCLLGITVFASYPMFSNYLIRGHDILFHLTRIEGIKSGLLSGQFPVRLHTSTYYGYGYAPAIFYPELFLYFPALLRIAGVSLTGTVQIFIIFINFATAGIMYFSAYRISKIRSIGIISSMLYVLASYHLCDLYTRFALGEALAMAFIPLLIYGVYELFYNDYSKWKYVVLGATGILQSHIITTLVAIAFVGLAAVICINKILEKNRFIACIKATVFTVLVNLWFAVPLITMMREDMNVSSLARNVEDLTLYASQLFINFTMNGNSRNIIGLDMEGVMPLHIGLPILVGVALFIYLMVSNKVRDKRQENVVVALSGFGALSAYATTNLYPWKLIVNIPLLGKASRMIQFPWRLLSFATAFLAIVAAYGVFYLVKKAETRRVLMAAVFAISVLFAAQYMDDFLNRDIYCYKGATTDKTGIGTGEYYYDGTNYFKLRERGEVVVSSSDSVLVQASERINGKLNVNYKNSSNEEQYIEVPLAYYPFYKARLDNKEELKISKGENNVVRIAIPANSGGKVKIYYQKEMLWLVADIISAIAIILLLMNFSAIKQNKKTMLHK